MSKNKLVIDLRRIKLSTRQSKDLHEAIHKAVTTELEKLSPPDIEKKPTTRGITRGEIKVAEAGTMTANVHVTFTNTVPGKSELTAKLNGNKQVIDHTSIITFENVQSGDIIAIQGKSLGMTTVTLDISADPMQMNFPPGHFNDNFFIN